MERIRHCELCQNEKVDFKQGVICKVSNKKPSFEIKCSDIDLSEKFKTTFTKVLVKAKSLEKKRISVYLNFLMYFGLGIAVFSVGLYIGVVVLDGGIISTVPNVFSGISLFLIGSSIKNLVSYLSAYSESIKKKESIEAVLVLYELWYIFDIEFSYTAHGLEEVATDLEIVKG